MLALLTWQSTRKAVQITKKENEAKKQLAQTKAAAQPEDKADSTAAPTLIEDKKDKVQEKQEPEKETETERAVIDLN